VGATGERGPVGLPGQSGVDGAAVLSGPRPPAQEDGVDADHWIDLSSAGFGFYKKASGSWTKLAELRVSQLGQQQTAVGGSGSGGGGVDVPPVIIDLDPPDNGNNNKPVRPGDLWFDSDQLALYVATKDSSKKIVWVICIPGVTGVPGTQAASVPVVYPKAVDGEEWINPLTQVTYKYNAPKKQWINVNGGIVSVQDKPPLTPQTGSLWFDTEDDELTLYIYEGGAWVPAAPPVSLDGINATIDAALVVQNDLLDRVQAGEIEQRKIELALEELQVTKGSVARYKITATNIGAAGRNGELYVNNAVAADVQAMSFAPFDLNGQPIKPCNVGDIVELVQAVALANVGEVSRYRILSGDSNALTVEYLSGTNDFEVDQTQEVYIYPQNEAGVSKDYVDTGLAGKLNNSGASDLANDTDWKVRQQNASGSNKTLLQIKAGELGVYNLKEPTQSHHAATKAYVDAKPSGGSGFGISASRPPGLKFFLSIVNLPNGYFQWWTNNNTNNQHLELSTTDRDGIAWGTNTLREDVRYNDKIPFTIWEVSNNAWKMKVTGTISRIDFHPDHALCYVSSKTALNGGNFVNGAGPYYITISGLF
jgi:hypothetical protein